MTGNVFADEIKDEQVISEETPGVSESVAPPAAEPEEQEQTPSQDEVMPEDVEEAVSEDEASETVSEDEVLPAPEEQELPEESAGTEVQKTVSDDAGLRAAIASATASDHTTITLSGNINLSGLLEIGGGKKITLDLNGSKLTGTGSAIDELYTRINSDSNHLLKNKFLVSVSGNGTEVTLEDSKQTGSLSHNGEATDSVVSVWDGAQLTLRDITLTAYNNKLQTETGSAMLRGGKAVMVVGNTANVADAATYYARPAVNSKVILEAGADITDAYIGVYPIGSGATVVINEGAKITGRNTAIQNQGELNYFGTDITINGGTLIAKNPDGNAVYHAGAGNLNINGGSFLAATAIETSNGIANIRGGSTALRSNGEFDADLIGTYTYQFSGSTTGGCAVCYSPYANYAGVKSELNITGGDFYGKKGLYISKRSQATTANLTNDTKLTVSGGSFTAVSGDGVVVRDDSFDPGLFKGFITGGSFNQKPGDNLLKSGYFPFRGTDGRYNAEKKRSAYLKAVLTMPVVLKGQIIKEVVKAVLIDENGTEYPGTSVAGLSYNRTDEKITSMNAVAGDYAFDRAERWYLGVKKATAGFNISGNGADETAGYEVDDTISADRIVSFDVEETEGDTISIRQIKDICYSVVVNDPYEYFEIAYTHNGNRIILSRSNSADIKWGESEGSITNNKYTYDNKDANTKLFISVSYLQTESMTPFYISRFPVIVTGGSVSTLAGDELIERYYGKISVYATDEKDNTGAALSENVAMNTWFDPASSMIDLTGITNTRKGTYEAVLKDLGRLKDGYNKNYELRKKPVVRYIVEPSLVIDFREPNKETELAPTKIRSVTDRTPMTIYSFSNERDTSKATWCLKTVSYDEIEQSWYEKMVNTKDLNIDSDCTVDRLGTIFKFSEEFLDTISENGARFTFYEIFAEDKTSNDKYNKHITVKAIAPVIYNGCKFVASDDSRYYSRGLVKSGYSPTLDVQVWDGQDKKMAFGTDYTLSYKNNKNAAGIESDREPEVVVTGKGVYEGLRIEANFTILAADISHLAEAAVTTQYVKYNGKTLKQRLKVTFRSGANAGKEIPASAYDITIYDKNKRDVTSKKYGKSELYARYTVVATANGTDQNITGSIDGVLTGFDGDGNEIRDEVFFYGIPKYARKMTLGGTLKKVTYSSEEPPESIADFIDKEKFYADTKEKRFVFDDIGDSISVDLVDSKDERTAIVYNDETGMPSDSGIYYLKVRFANTGLKNTYNVYEPVYAKVTYAGTKLRAEDVMLKKKSFDFADGNEFTDLPLKISKRLRDKGMDGVKILVYRNGSVIDLPDLEESGYVIEGSQLDNSQVGRYRICVLGTGPYYGKYDLKYTVGVQAYDKDRTPVAAFVNTSDPEDPEDTAEAAVPYDPSGEYAEIPVKVVWTTPKNEKIVLKQRTVSGPDAGKGDYYIKWGTFKQVGPQKGKVTIVGTGTYFTGSFKKKFDVTE